MTWPFGYIIKHPLDETSTLHKKIVVLHEFYTFLFEDHFISSGIFWFQSSYQKVQTIIGVRNIFVTPVWTNKCDIQVLRITIFLKKIQIKFQVNLSNAIRIWETKYRLKQKLNQCKQAIYGDEPLLKNDRAPHFWGTK